MRHSRCTVALLSGVALGLIAALPAPAVAQAGPPANPTDAAGTTQPTGAQIAPEVAEYRRHCGHSKAIQCITRHAGLLRCAHNDDQAQIKSDLTPHFTRVRIIPTPWKSPRSVRSTPWFIQ